MPGVDDALEMFHKMADELALDDDEREDFVNTSMARKGFKQRSTWAEPDGDDNKGGGDFFSRKRESGRETRRVPGRDNKGSGGVTRYASGN